MRKKMQPSASPGRISQLFEGTDKGARIVSPRWGWLRVGSVTQPGGLGYDVTAHWA
jgi:hypothetical protein